MGRMATMTEEGDVKVEWEPGKHQEEEAARSTFDNMTQNKGYAAFRTDARGQRGQQIREFDPSAERILLVPPMQGG